VPRTDFVDVVVPAGAKAGTIVSAEVNQEYFCEVLLPFGAQANTSAKAQVSGYAVPPADIFAVGVSMFIMLTGAPPWREAHLKDEFFRYVRANSLVELRNSWGMPALTPAAAEVLLGMTAAESARRPSAEECLSLSWFKELAEMAVPTHTGEEFRRSVTLSMAGA